MSALGRKIKNNLKFTFFIAVTFMLMSVAYLVGRSQTLRLRHVAVSIGSGKETDSYYEGMLHHFFTSKQLEDKLKMRETIWERIVNSTRNQKRERRFPDVLIVGAERCGVDGLTNLLRLHPLIKVTSTSDDKFFTTHYLKGPEYYRQNMPWASKEEVVLDAAQTYFSWPPMSIPNRVKTVLPKAKIIVLLCNPIERAVVDFYEELKVKRIPKTSKYEIFLGTFLRKFSPDKLSVYTRWDEKIQSILFDAFTEDYATHILTSGIYYHHAVRWNAEFDSNHIIYVSRDEMMRETGDVFEKIQKFLHLPELIFKEDFRHDSQNVSYCFSPEWKSRSEAPERRCPLRGETHWNAEQSRACIDSLKNFYAPYNKKLYYKLGKNFGW